jgi:hypothetical protein
MKYRIYPNKANTIASGQFEIFNSSQNQIADLWYGGGTLQQNIYRDNSFSRHLLLFDLTELQRRISEKEINPNYVTSYKLKMKNAVPSDKMLEPEFEKNTLNKNIASSFDLVAFPINQSWDEGRGYDLIEGYNYLNRTGDLTISGTSNWISATTIVSWTQPGIYTNPTASTSFYATQHFELGSEDLDMNITDIVKDWLSGGTINNGIGIAYARPYELASANTRYIASFFTHKTNSSFKPYIEVNYDQTIRDDRNQVTNNRISRLYLYLFSGNTPTNYYSASTVSIKNSAGSTIHSGLVPTHHSKGVYFIDVWMSGTTKGQKYKDVWAGISFNPPYDQQDITQNFEIKDNYYTSNARDVNDYVITTYGIDNNAVLQPDENVRVYIDTRINYSNNRPFIEFGLEYKITMNNNIELIEWTDVNSAVINGCFKSFIDVDTSWLMTNQNYQINFRIAELGTKKILSEKIHFKVVERLYPVR